MVMVSLSVACFAFGPKERKEGCAGDDCRPRQKGENSQRMGKRGMEPRMFESVDLTPEQKDKMQEIRKAHRDQMFELRTEIQKAKIEEKVSLHKHDFNKAKKYAKSINATEGKIKLDRIEMMEECYNVLTKEQKAKL